MSTTITSSAPTSSAPGPRPATAPAPRRIAVFGATGGIGRQVVAQALEAGHSVTVLARSPERVGIDNPRLTVLAGDATDLEAVRRVVRGADAVVCALGAPALRRTRIRTEGTRRILGAMQAEGVSRLLCVSVLGAGSTRASLPFFFRRIIFPTYLRWPVADHEGQEELIEASDVDWTIVRPPNLTDGPRTDTAVTAVGDDISGLSMKVSRADVAAFMLQQLDRDEHHHHAVGLAYAA